MFPRWTGTSTSFSYTLSNEKIKSWIEKGRAKREGKQAPPPTENEDGNMEPIQTLDNGQEINAKRRGREDSNTQDGYVKTEIPWSISANYTVSYRPGSTFDYDKMRYKFEFVQNLSFSGNIGLGKGWKASASTSIDLKAKKFSYTNFTVSRDLHCWSMSASFVPFGPYKSYSFHIGVNASMLADLKYDKSSADATNRHVDWW